MNIKTKIFYKKFTSQIIKIFILAIISAIFTQGLWLITGGIFSSQTKIDNYIFFIPSYLRKESWFLSKENFIIFGLFWVFLYFLFTYLFDSQSEKLMIKISDYIRNRLLKKFRNLKLEEKLKRKGEINNLVEIESDVVANIWVNFTRKLYEGTFYLWLLLYVYWSDRNSQGGINKKAVIFAVFWIIFINGFIYFLNRLIFQHGKLSKEKVDKEYELINKEINNSVLIDGMGLNSIYEQKQLILTRKAKRKKISYKKTLLLGKSIPFNLLINLFPSLLLLLILDKNFIGINFAITWNVLNNCVMQLGYLWNYSDYSSSLTRINAFLSLPERDDNLFGTKLPLNIPIKVIRFENVSFRYTEQKTWLINNYSREFLIGINYLQGKNGDGKTTILYLLLGILKPQKGKITIQDERGKIYNLHHDINLKYWREQTIAYCAHDNLIDQGSTGQKQWVNINNILKTRQESFVFCFDEAENALDREKKEELKEKLSNVVKRRKIVICTKKTV